MSASPSSRSVASITTPGREEPLERELVDGLRAAAVDGRVVVPGRVHVGAVVGAEAREGVGGPALAVAQQLGPDAEQRLDRGGARGVVVEGHVGAQHVGKLRRVRADRRGQVDERQWASSVGGRLSSRPWANGCCCAAATCCRWTTSRRAARRGRAGRGRHGSPPWRRGIEVGGAELRGRVRARGHAGLRGHPPAHLAVAVPRRVRGLDARGLLPRHPHHHLAQLLGRGRLRRQPPRRARGARRGRHHDPRLLALQQHAGARRRRASGAARRGDPRAVRVRLLPGAGARAGVRRPRRAAGRRAPDPRRASCPRTTRS